MNSDERIHAAHELSRRLAIKSLAEFVRQGWHVVEPGTELIWNWHLDIVCDALERQTRDDPEYRKLLILQPPGTMKSLLVSVFQPAWEWLLRPSRRKIFVARDDELVVRDSRRTRDIAKSLWYNDLMRCARTRYGAKYWAFRKDQDSVVNFANTVGGIRQCQSLGACITGKRADDMVIDDPVDVKSVVLGSNESIRKRLAEIQSVIDISLENRVNDLEAAHWTLIMQRVHQSDPAGAAIESGEWKVIQLQMEFDPTEELNHKDDPRTEFGQLLFPQKFPESALDNLKKKLRHHYSAQYQQMPSSEEGGYVQREWFSDASRYEKTPKVNIYMASDFAVTEKTEKNEPDFTEHGVFGVGPNGHVYVLDWWCGQTNSDVWVESLLDLAAKWRPIAYFPEGGKDWSAVAPLYNMLRKKRKPAIFLRVEPLHPISDKTARARAFQAMASMGFIHFPANAPWAQRIIDQCVDFPAAKHDDAFDVLSAMCRAIDQAHPAILAPAEKPAKKSDYGNNETYRSASSWKTT